MSARERLITLTTDFGLADPYVAAMKGVILSINPAATIVDVSHDVRPQQVVQGTFLLEAARPYFPPGTIHVAVVDPGVGSERAGLALVTAEAAFVGPDNGILSAALPDEARPAAAEGARPSALPPGVRAFRLEDPRFQRHPVSDTFHGRDVFAPAAAHLSLGVDPAELGPETPEITMLHRFRAAEAADGSLAGRVLHIDRFGNVITSARRDQLPPGGITVRIAGRDIPGPARTYAEAEDLTALIGSTGYLEVALPNGNAAGALGVGIGEAVTVTRS